VPADSLWYLRPRPMVPFSSHSAIPIPHPDNPNTALRKARHTCVPSPHCCHRFPPHNSSGPLFHPTHHSSPRHTCLLVLPSISYLPTLLSPVSSSRFIRVLRTVYVGSRRRCGGSRAEAVSATGASTRCDLLTQSILHKHRFTTLIRLPSKH